MTGRMLGGEMRADSIVFERDDGSTERRDLGD
jgi:hypothetical protein